MKAVTTSDFGSPEQFTVSDLPVPRPAAGEVLVRVAAASVNPADLWLTSGAARGMVEVPFPMVLGNDFAGTITEIGPEVSGYAVGDDIFGFALPRAMAAIPAMQTSSTGTGSMAEYVAVGVDSPFIVHRPQSVSPVDAAALATAGLTANAVVASAAVQPGERVLVIGATGGVGTAVLSLLATTGAHVTATATPADADVLRDLGADDTIGYAPEGYPAEVDVVLNLTLPGNKLGVAARALRPGGRLYTITDPSPQPASTGRDDIEAQGVSDIDGKLGGMRKVADLAASGRLKATIDRHYPLSEGAQAYIDLGARHILGKLVVTP
ncbi:NADP-dependent oxidoreductase [Streptomyces hydrogenans]